MWIIYKHTNLDTDKYYIGQTKCSMQKRWKEHVSAAKGKRNDHITNAIRKYGELNWKHEIIESNIETQEDANDRETFWIAMFCSNQRHIGYNTKAGGNQSTMTEETKTKISEANKGKKPPALAIENSVNARIGKTLSKEHCDKIGKSNLGNKSRTGHTFSEETKKKMSDSASKLPRTEEVKRKISEANKGNKSNKGQKWKLVDGKRFYYTELKETKCTTTKCERLIMKEKKNGSQLNLWITKEIREKLLKSHKEFMKKYDIEVSLAGFVKSLLEKQLHKDEK